MIVYGSGDYVRFILKRRSHETSTEVPVSKSAGTAAVRASLLLISNLIEVHLH